MVSTIARIAASLLMAATACGHSNNSSGPAASTRSRHRLEVVGGGVVLDPRTHLEWTSRDQDESMTWTEADRRCRDLVRGGRTDWRLPEIGELRALYERHRHQPCGNMKCHLDRAIRLQSPYVWSATSRGPETRFYFDFSTATSLSPRASDRAPSTGPRLVRRVLCVREASPSSSTAPS